MCVYHFIIHLLVPLVVIILSRSLLVSAKKLAEEVKKAYLLSDRLPLILESESVDDSLPDACIETDSVFDRTHTGTDRSIGAITDGSLFR